MYEWMHLEDNVEYSANENSFDNNSTKYVNSFIQKFMPPTATAHTCDNMAHWTWRLEKNTSVWRTFSLCKYFWQILRGGYEVGVPPGSRFIYKFYET